MYSVLVHGLGKPPTTESNLQVVSSGRTPSDYSSVPTEPTPTPAPGIAPIVRWWLRGGI